MARIFHSDQPTLVYRVYLPQLARLAAISGYGLGGFRTKGAHPHYLDLPVSGAGRRPQGATDGLYANHLGRQHTRLVLADDLDAVAQRKASVRIIGNGGVERSVPDGDARRRGDHAPDVRSGDRVAPGRFIPRPHGSSAETSFPCRS